MVSKSFSEKITFEKHIALIHLEASVWSVVWIFLVAFCFFSLGPKALVHIEEDSFFLLPWVFTWGKDKTVFLSAQSEQKTKHGAVGIFQVNGDCDLAFHVNIELFSSIPFPNKFIKWISSKLWLLTSLLVWCCKLQVRVVLSP